MLTARFKACAASLALAAALTPAGAADRAHPTVVELFQSQGCSSCPPANAVLNAIAGRPDVLALSFAVTYWDQLGWKDRFATPAFTARQWDYARAARRGNVSTPQMIVNGRGVLVGSNPAQVDDFIRRFDRGANGPAISRDGAGVLIGRGDTTRPATVWLVQYDPRIIPVAIKAGENAGRTLPHRNIVRGLSAMGRWDGKPMRIKLPPLPDAMWRGAILVQDGTGGPIIAAGPV